MLLFYPAYGHIKAHEHIKAYGHRTFVLVINVNPNGRLRAPTNFCSVSINVKSYGPMLVFYFAYGHLKAYGHIKTYGHIKAYGHIPLFSHLTEFIA